MPETIEPELVSMQRVAECVVVFVFGRRNKLWGFPPTSGWLRVWYYLFLADETHYEVFHLVGGWIWQCLLLAGHVMNCGGCDQRWLTWESGIMWSICVNLNLNFQLKPWRTSSRCNRVSLSECLQLWDSSYLEEFWAQSLHRKRYNYLQII